MEVIIEQLKLGKIFLQFCLILKVNAVVINHVGFF
ncbi:hypothetical protein PC116_g2662 [Phytophthora cactorum]|nr:hypothetical protein PC116_g2662 [Phytophthora cactorum]